MKKIFKYQLNINYPTKIELPEGSEILSVQMQHGNLFMWVLIAGTKYIVEKRFFQVFGTGHAILEKVKQYLATVQDGMFVWHVFEMEECGGTRKNAANCEGFGIGNQAVDNS